MIIDANILIALLDGADRNHAAASVILSEESVGIHAVNLAEVASQLFKRDPKNADAILDTIEGLEGLVIASDPLFRLAGRLHGRRPTKKVSLADCFAAALALTRDQMLVTTDNDFSPYVASDGLKLRLLGG